MWVIKWREQDENQGDQLEGYCNNPGKKNNERLAQDSDSGDGEERMNMRNI